MTSHAAGPGRAHRRPPPPRGPHRAEPRPLSAIMHRVWPDPSHGGSRSPKQLPQGSPQSVHRRPGLPVPGIWGRHLVHPLCEPKTPSPGSSGQRAQPWARARVDGWSGPRSPGCPPQPECDGHAVAGRSPWYRGLCTAVPTQARSSTPSRHPLCPVTPADWPTASLGEPRAGGAPGTLTLEAGPSTWVPVPAPLHEAQQVAAGAGPGSAHGRQLGAVALHHLHHDVQDVLLV